MTGRRRVAPLEPVPGQVHPLLPAKGPTVAPTVLAAADRYAAANRSSALLVWRAGKLELARYYGATSAATLLVSKSLSKPLGAIAVGRAIALGKIRSLDQPLADFFPEWRGTPKAAMHVRHLLDIRSGLLEQAFSSDPESPLNRGYIHPNHGRVLIEKYPLGAVPGTRYGYGNASAELVAPLIQRATGRRYAEFIGRECSPRSARREATSGSTGPAGLPIRGAACTCRRKASWSWGSCSSTMVEWERGGCCQRATYAT